MIRNTFNSYFKSLLKTTSTINKSNANETFPNLSLRQFHDKIIIKATSKLSVVRKEQIKKALSAYDSLGLSDEQFEKQLVSEAGVVIAGISYQIKPVINSPFFWLSVSRKLNPTKDIKPQLIESKKYDLGKEGKPYKDGVFNFIQDSAIISNINFVAQASFNKIPNAEELMKEIKSLADKWSLGNLTFEEQNIIKDKLRYTQSRSNWVSNAEHKQHLQKEIENLWQKMLQTI